MSDLHERIIDLVRQEGYQRREEQFQLASGQMSHDYIDGKLAVARGADLQDVADAIIAEVIQDFDAVGGLTMGADALAHAVAIRSGCRWFSVRKAPKGRGLDKWIEGAALDSQSRVLLVDDVVTTGGSIILALDQVVAAGATVVAALTLVDRGDTARSDFEGRRVPYYALVTYSDLGIDRVGPARATSPRV